MRPDPSAHAIRIQQVLFGLAVIGLGLMAVRSMMGGGTGNLPVIGGGILVIAVILLMDEKYWMLYPLSYWGQGLFTVPLFDLPELGCITIIGAHFVRRALRRETNTKSCMALFLAAPYFIWAALIYVLNPSGLFIFGGISIGARFYFKMILGFWAMYVLSVQRITENDCRHLFHGAVVLSTLILVKGVLISSLAEETTSIAAYEFLPASVLFYWLFSRYRLREVLRINWKLAASLVLAGLTVYSGKRRATFNIAIIPLLLAFLTRKDRGRAILLSALGFVCLTLLTFGQGRLYELPISAQRGLSFLPGRWHSSLTHFERGSDPFREIVNEYAREIIRSNPWFGRKGFAIDVEELRWIHTSRTSQQYEGHGTSGNWHSTWLGMMADFGIPGAFFWGLFSFGFLFIGIRSLTGSPTSPYQRTLIAYCTLAAALMLLASNTSGHSAMQPFIYWPFFGLLLGIRGCSGNLVSIPPLLSESGESSASRSEDQQENVPEYTPRE